MKKSWKTTSAGIVAIAGAIVAFIFTPHDQANIMAEIAGLVAGIGLIFAKDTDVTGGTTPQ